MENKKKLECPNPKCQSSNIIVNSVTSGAIVQNISGIIPEPTHPAWYQCLKCGKYFPSNDNSEQN